VLAVIEPGLAAPRSVHSTGVPPRAVRVGAHDGTLDDTVAKVLAEEAGAVGDGRTVVLAPTARVRALRERLLGTAEPVAGPDTPDGPADPSVDLTSPVVVLPIASAKGLEFDAVVLVEPAEVLAESPRGANDLYVALTRATQRLAVVHTGDLPPMLGRLAPPVRA
jgi:superfamily I DNA/RNA helicase